MPGINLSRIEAIERSKHVSVESYDVFLDLTATGDTFIAKSTVKFACTSPGYDTFIDAVATRIDSATLNGKSIDTSDFDGESIFLKNLEAMNVLVIEAEVAYSKTGEGLQKSVDPVDNEIYLYSQGETAHIHKMYPCFDQPDLKAVFNLTVLAPKHWEAVSNSPVESATREGAFTRTTFLPTPRISTYITALVAGPYHHVHDEYVGEKRVPLGIYCRKSLATDLDPEEIFLHTKEGFAYFEKTFGLAYPFEKYDQIAVVDFNWGAMENSGVVTFREDALLFRSHVTDRNRQARAHIILHEMAHMWFGNMVTMGWWDDLWLNESFAEWTSYLALVEGTRFTTGWASFVMEGKSWAYIQDQQVTTHPIAVDMPDIDSVNANFDGISYAKGSSVMHQLCAYVGRDNFIKGLHNYFTKYAWKNTQLSDLLTELQSASGRDLGTWSATWLQTAGINTLRPVLSIAGDVYAKVLIKQDAPTVPSGSGEIRPHHLSIGLFDLIDGTLILRKSILFDVMGDETEVVELANEPVADLLLINDKDLAYTKIRFDERSLATIRTHLGDIPDHIARVICWVAVWDMWRDGEITTTDFARMVLTGLKTEQLVTITSALGNDILSAIEIHSNPVTRDDLREEMASGLLEILINAEAESDIQLQMARIFAAIAHSSEQIAYVRTLLDGGLPGLRVDRDLRWYLINILAERGAYSRTEVDAELAKDKTLTGEMSHAQAVASFPTKEAKAMAWKSLINDDLSSFKRRALHRGFMRTRQEEVLVEYVDVYFATLNSMWRSASYEVSSSNIEMLYPRMIIAQSTLDKTDTWLNGEGKSAPDTQRRLVSEGRDALARALRVQRKDS